MDDWLIPQQHQLYALMAPRAIRQYMLTHLLVELSAAGPVRVLDGGNRFDARGLARELRRRSRNFHTCLQRIQVARAFTAFQMLTLLQECAPQPIPTLALDLLTSFYDENIHPAERKRLLAQVLERLRGLAGFAPVLVSAASPQPDDALLNWLAQNADQVWRYESEAHLAQARLF